MSEIIKVIKVSKKPDMPELPDTERMTCDCGMNLLTRRYKTHLSHWKHKYFAGLITKEEHDEYENKTKNRYKNLSEDKRKELQKKSREYQRDRSQSTNGAYYAEQRLKTIVCECGATINKTYSKAHYKSQKHIYGLEGAVPPKRTITRKPKEVKDDSDLELVEAMQEMIAN